MRFRFLNFGDDIHDQSVRERISDAIQRIPPRLLTLAFPNRVWSPILNYATSLRVRERIDRERATELATREERRDKRREETREERREKMKEERKEKENINGSRENEERSK